MHFSDFQAPTSQKRFITSDNISTWQTSLSKKLIFHRLQIKFALVQQIDIMHSDVKDTTMVRTQIQLPDDLYARAKKLCESREISLAEMARRGIEYILSVYAAVLRLSPSVASTTTAPRSR